VKVAHVCVVIFRGLSIELRVGDAPILLCRVQCTLYYIKDMGAAGARQLLLKARTELYAPGTHLARAGEIADRLMVIMSGQVYLRQR
jgi:hypothetical protein